MDNDLSRWLKDHLGLPYMSEADVSTLMYHPRHGNLCRKLLKFLAESTLCSQKFPHVYVIEEYKEVIESLTDRNQQLDQAIGSIEKLLCDHHNQERKLNSLRSQLDCLEDFHIKYTKAMNTLETIANRPNWRIQQVDHKIDEIDYIDSGDFLQIYSDCPETELSKADEHSALTSRRLNVVDEELHDLKEKVNIIHQAISKVFSGIKALVDNVEEDEESLQLPELSKHHLDSIKVPGTEDVEVITDQEARDLVEFNVKMTQDVKELDRQVCDMKKKYEHHKASRTSELKARIEKCLLFKSEVQQLEVEVGLID